MSDLRTQLSIPGVAYAIVEDGDVVQTGAFGTSSADSDEPFTTSTPLNIQSIVKTMAAVIVMQLVEADRLDLDAPVVTLLPDSGLGGDVLVRHLMTHTSEGTLGREYVYSGSRYSLLAGIIERVTGDSYEQVLRRQIIDAAQMTWHDSPDLGSASGLVTTVDDLVAYVQAIDRGELLEDASLQRLATPSISTSGQPLPTSLGWFAQSIQDERVMWSYGQSESAW